MKVIRRSDIPSRPASHEDPHNPGVIKKILLESGAIPEGKLQMINWAFMEIKKGFRPHFHEHMAELFIVVAGSFRIRSGKEELEISAGDTVIIPEREVHEMWNTADTLSEYIVMGIISKAGGKTVVVT